VPFLAAGIDLFVAAGTHYHGSEAAVIVARRIGGCPHRDGGSCPWLELSPCLRGYGLRPLRSGARTPGRPVT